jgi:hypothetical protein
MALTAFTKSLGTTQGRIASGDDASEGSYVFVLGSEAEGVLELLNPGDYVEVKQAVDVTGLKLIRANLLFRMPEKVTGPYKWVASMLVDGVVSSSVTGTRNKTRRITDLVALVDGLSGVKDIAIRLSFLNA